MKSHLLLPLIFSLAAVLSGEGSPASGHWEFIRFSGTERVSPIERFTSEERSSYPPAEKHIAELQNISPPLQGTLAIAAWMTVPSSRVSSQAVGGWLANPKL